MTNPEIQEWLDTAVGVHLNPDGAYGNQCVDAAQAYGSAIFGVGWATSIKTVGGANQILDRADMDYWVRTNNDPSKPNQIPAAGDVVVFGGSPANQWGHVAIVISANDSGMWVIQQDGFAPPLQYVNGDYYSAKPAHKAWLPYYGPGTGPVTGWLTPKPEKIINYKKPVAVPPVAVPPSSSQRVVISDVGVKYRPEPNTSKPETHLYVKGDVLNFVGWVRGQNVEGNDVWLKGIGGGFVWSGGVTPSGVSGLADLNPKAPAPAPVKPVESLKANQRKVGSKPANQRTEPNTKAAISASLDAGFVFTAKGFVKGESVDGNRIWYVGEKSGGYIWSGACTDVSIGSLPDLTKATTPVEAPKPVTPPTTTPVPTKPVETPTEPPVPVLVAELACVTDVIPAHPDNYQVGNFPGLDCTGAVIHQYGTKGIHTYASAVNYFKMSLAQRQITNPNAGPSSAHFVVDPEHITQCVSIFNRAYGAGKDGNHLIQIETDPYQDARTIANTRLLLLQLSEKLGNDLTVCLHSSIMATDCGKDIKISNYEGVTIASPVPLPVPPVVVPSGSVKVQIQDALKALDKLVEKL